MSKVTVQRTVEAPQEKVFAVFSDIPNAAKNVPGIKRCEVQTEGEVGVGTKWKETREMFGREHTEEMEIVAFVPKDRYVVSAESCGALYHTEFIFQGDGESTNVTMIFGASPQTMMAKIMSFFMGFMMTGSVRRLLEEDIEALKAVCEGGEKATG